MAEQGRAVGSKQLILASASPRRRQLLQQLGLDVVVSAANMNESRLPDESPADYVRRLASGKAGLVAQSYPGGVVLGADTIVVLEGRLLGKPDSMQDAFAMWSAMSGRWHQVLTGVAVQANGKVQTALSSSEVRFTEITRESMQAYWNTGEPADKAGGYAIQGYAARWIPEIHGSYSGIMGLPLYETAELLNEAGIHTLL